MDTATLIQKLIDIEVAVGNVEASVLKAMLREVEDFVIGLEKRMLAIMAENGRLRSAYCPHTGLCPLCHPEVAESNVAAKTASIALPISPKCPQR